MSDDKKIGKIEWLDLTVKNAEEVKDFYCKVIGWTHAPVAMGDYSDFVINLPSDGDTVVGICHARGSNANLPAQWLVYVRVDDVAKSAKHCTDSGGEVLDGPRKMGADDFCVIKDPAGAVIALLSSSQ